MADVYSAIILDDDYWDGTESWAGETSEANRDSKYSTRRYTSISAWEADRDGNSSGGDTEYGIIIGPWTSADTSQCRVEGWNADKVVVECPLTLPDGDNLAAHNGIYGDVTNSYRNEFTSGRNFYLFQTSDIIGVQVKNVVSYVPGIHYRASNQTYNIKRCVIDASTTNADGIGDLVSTTNTAYIENCVIYADRFNIDIRNGTSDGHIINCTSDGLSAAQNIYAGTGLKVRNCAAFNSGYDFNTVTDIANCASDDGDGSSAVDWDNEATDWAANFNDYSNYDYTPLDQDLPGAGIGPGSDSDVPTEDIIGNARSGSTCTIGAFEYAAAGGETFPIPILQMNHFNGGSI